MIGINISSKYFYSNVVYRKPFRYINLTDKILFYLF